MAMDGRNNNHTQIGHLRDVVEELSNVFTKLRLDNRIHGDASVIPYEHPSVRKFWFILDRIFHYGLKQRSSLWSGPAHYWTFLSASWGYSSMIKDALSFIERAPRANTPSGCAYAFVCFALHEKILGDAVQQLSMKPRLIAEWYERWSIIRTPALFNVLIDCLYELNVIYFELPLQHFDFDSPVSIVGITINTEDKCLSRGSSSLSIRSDVEHGGFVSSDSTSSVPVTTSTLVDDVDRFSRLEMNLKDAQLARDFAENELKITRETLKSLRCQQQSSLKEHDTASTSLVPGVLNMTDFSLNIDGSNVAAPIVGDDVQTSGEATGLADSYSKERFEEIAAQNVTMEQKIASLTRDCDVAHTLAANLQSKIDQFEASEGQLKRNSEKLDERIVELIRERELLSIKVNDLSCSIEKTNAILTDSRNSERTLTTRVAELEAELAAMTTSNRYMAAQLDGLNGAVERETESLKFQLSTERMAVRASADSRAQTEQKIELYRSVAEETKSTYNALKLRYDLDTTALREETALVAIRASEAESSLIEARSRADRVTELEIQLKARDASIHEAISDVARLEGLVSELSSKYAVSGKQLQAMVVERHEANEEIVERTKAKLEHWRRAEEMEARFRDSLSLVKEVTIHKGMSFKYEVIVPTAGLPIDWQFRTRHKDIAFGVTYNGPTNPAPGEKCQEFIVPIERIKSHLSTAKGHITAERTGIYTLHWDNTYSKVTKKKLSFLVYVGGSEETPCTEEDIFFKPRQVLNSFSVDLEADVVNSSIESPDDEGDHTDAATFD